MKTLIIYAHPNTGWHSPKALAEAESMLKQNKTDFHTIDLYKIKYDPILHEDEHYTSGNYNISAQNKKFQKMIKDADNLLFIFPLWWMSMPAILKGFIDRVFTARFAYKYVNGKPGGLLKGKKAALIISTGGSKWLYRAIFHLPFMSMKLGILRFCGIKSKIFLVDKATKQNQVQELKIKKAVKKAIKYLK